MYNNETEESALVIELKEELNLDIVPNQKIAETTSNIKDQITYWWSAEIKTGGIKINNSEIADASFLPKNR